MAWGFFWCILVACQIMAGNPLRLWSGLTAMQLFQLTAPARKPSTAIRHVESAVPHICVWASSLSWGWAWFLKVKKHYSFRGVLAFVNLQGGEQGALEKWDSLVDARELPSPSREVGWVAAAWGPCGAFWRHGGARGAGQLVVPCGVLQLRAARASLRRRALPSLREVT